MNAGTAGAGQSLVNLQITYGVGSHLPVDDPPVPVVVLREHQLPRAADNDRIIRLIPLIVRHPTRDDQTVDRLVERCFPWLDPQALTDDGAAI